MIKKNDKGEIIKIKHFCHECNGEGSVSTCCDFCLDGNRCGLCGKFTKHNPCYHCDGNGEIKYELGDKVEIFICAWSPKYLMDMLYKINEVGQNKTFIGTIVKFIDDFDVIVSIKWKKYKINVNDLIIR